MDISSDKQAKSLLRKGNIKKENISLLTAAQNNAIMTNRIKVEIE